MITNDQNLLNGSLKQTMRVTNPSLFSPHVSQRRRQTCFSFINPLKQKTGKERNAAIVENDKYVVSKGGRGLLHLASTHGHFITAVRHYVCSWCSSTTICHWPYHTINDSKKIMSFERLFKMNGSSNSNSFQKAKISSLLVTRSSSSWVVLRCSRVRGKKKVKSLASSRGSIPINLASTGRWP